MFKERVVIIIPIVVVDTARYTRGHVIPWKREEWKEIHVTARVGVFFSVIFDSVGVGRWEVYD